MCDISVQISSPGHFSSPPRTRPNSNPFTPIRNLFFSRRERDSAFPSSAGTGAATLGKRRRTNSDEVQSEPAQLDSSPLPPLANSPLPPRPRKPVPSSPPSPASSSSPSQTSSPLSIQSSPSLARTLPPPPPPPPTPTPAHRRSRVRVALQTPDETHNAIVITALEEVPFCCHEDLLTMSRDQLVAVAASLNKKLPKVMRIDVSDGRTDVFIRKSIEVLVGISKPPGTAVEPPGAPKAVKSRRLHEERVRRDIPRRPVRNDGMDMDIDEPSSSHLNPSTPKSNWPRTQSSPGLMSSPLAAKRASRTSSSARAYDLGALASIGTPRLARLEEEDELIEERQSASGDGKKGDGGEDDEESKRAKKRRKISISISDAVGVLGSRSRSSSRSPLSSTSESGSRIRRWSGSFGIVSKRKGKGRASKSNSDSDSGSGSSPSPITTTTTDDVEMSMSVDNVDLGTPNPKLKFQLPGADSESHASAEASLVGSSGSMPSPLPLRFTSVSAPSPPPSRLWASESRGTKARTRTRSRSMDMMQHNTTPRTRVQDALRKLALGRLNANAGEVVGAEEF